MLPKVEAPRPGRGFRRRFKRFRDLGVFGFKGFRDLGVLGCRGLGV